MYLCRSLYARVEKPVVLMAIRSDGVGLWHETCLVGPRQKRMRVCQHAEIRSGGGGAHVKAQESLAAAKGRMAVCAATGKLKNAFRPAFWP